MGADEGNANIPCALLERKGAPHAGKCLYAGGKGGEPEKGKPRELPSKPGTSPLCSGDFLQLLPCSPPGSLC